MPAKLPNPKSRPASKVESPAPPATSPRPKAPPAQREYAALRLFLAQDNGFRLALATFDRPATRDGLMARLVDDLAKSHLLLTVLDVTQGEGSLLRRVEEHLAAQPAPDGWRRAVAVVNIEARLTYSDVPVRKDDPAGRDLTFLEEANLHRDAFPAVCPCPLLLWLTELAESALTRTAPDLWHWRNARFDFEREGSFLSDFRAHPAERVAWFEQIAAASRRLGDKRGQVGDLVELGNAKLEMGDARAAIPHFEAALAQAREVGHRRDEGAALGNLGSAYAALGNARKAIEYHEQSLVTKREIGDRRGEGNTLGNLGNAYYSLGDIRKAIEFYEQALIVVRETGDRRSEGNWISGLAIAHVALGDPHKAIEFFEQHRASAREIGDRRGEGHALGNLGSAYAALGDARKAAEFYDLSLVIKREIGDIRGEGNALWNSALVSDTLSNRDKAITHAEAALKIYEQIEDPHAAKVRARLAEWRGQ